MHIVIVGASDIGTYIASIMSKQKNDITLIDIDKNKLEQASHNMDIATRHGMGTDCLLLEELAESSPVILIALTEDDETNLVICTMAKNLGYSQTIARIRKRDYFNQTSLNFQRLFHVDHFIGPEYLAANDIFKCMMMPGSINVENFAYGAVCMRTINIPEKWRKGEKTLSELNIPKDVMVGLIYRKEKKDGVVIFPHGNDHILIGDEVTFIGQTEEIYNLHQYFGQEQQPIKSVVIIGGSLIGVNLARTLIEKDIDVRIIDNDYNHCCKLSETLPKCTILCHMETDLDFLESEKINSADYCVVCTAKDEVNILAAVLAKRIGCNKIVVSINSTKYTPIIDELGISFTVSPRASAANRILSVVQAETLSSIVALYESQAEIMEIKVPLDSKIVGIPLSTLGPLLPNDFLIAIIQNRGRIIVANGNRILCPGDTIIAISSPRHVTELNKIF